MIDGSGIGVYFYDGSSWIKIGGDGTITSADLTDNAVTTSKIADDAVTLDKLKVYSGQVALSFTSDAAGATANVTPTWGCNADNTFYAITGYTNVNCVWWGAAWIRCFRMSASSVVPNVVWVCFQ